MDWLDLLSVQGTVKSLLQHHISKASILRHSAFFIVQISHPHMTIGKTIAFTRWIYVGKEMSLLFNMLSRLVIGFLPRSKCLLISWLQSPSAVILEPPKINSHCFHCFPIYLPWSDGTGCHDLGLLNVEFQASFFALLFHFHHEVLQFLFAFCHKGGVMYISEVIDSSPGNCEVFTLQQLTQLSEFLQIKLEYRHAEVWGAGWQGPQDRIPPIPLAVGWMLASLWVWKIDGSWIIL